MQRYDFDIPLTFRHRVVFTRDVFSQANEILAELLAEGGGQKAVLFIESSVAEAWPDLQSKAEDYFAQTDVKLQAIIVQPGGEICKADNRLVEKVWRAIEQHGIDRHSYALVVGGGAFLDAAGFAISTAHRGVRLLRFPTTTLAQDDSGVGVKNAYNAFHKKNWVGNFSVPFAVVNDFAFLETQPEDGKISGLIEAIKVALVKDRDFFEWIEAHVDELAQGHGEIFEECVKRSALHHARHIAEGGDAFEDGSSRPLDFGHWAAHKIEALTDYQLSHADAVAVGLALDVTYGRKIGMLSDTEATRILRVLERLSLDIYHPALDLKNAQGMRLVFEGLDEFREHLGGQLTVLLLAEIGKGTDVHEFDLAVLEASIEEIQQLALADVMA